MADNLIDALVDLIEDDGIVNARVWADEAPPNATKPYITLFDAVALTPGLKGDGTTIMLTRLVQADLWEHLDRESPPLSVELFGLLDGALLVLDNGTRLRLAVDDAPRLPEIDTNTAHRAITISVRHDPSTP